MLQRFVFRGYGAILMERAPAAFFSVSCRLNLTVVMTKCHIEPADEDAASLIINETRFYLSNVRVAE